MRIINAPFCDEAEIRAARAANEAFIRAQSLGYSRTSADQFARIARREASEWESPQHTALRIVLPKRARISGNPGGAA